MSDETPLQFEIAREVAEEWTRGDHMRLPTDDMIWDDGVASWVEVDRLLADRLSRAA